MNRIQLLTIPFIVFIAFGQNNIGLTQIKQYRPPNYQLKPINPLPDKYSYGPEYFLRQSEFILYIDGKTMEQSLAQLVRFYERFDCSEFEPSMNSGQALIYEQSSLPKNKKIFPAEVRTRHIRLAADYLCNQTEGTFRSKYLEDRVLAVYKKRNSLFNDILIPRLSNKNLTVNQAFQILVNLANRQTRKAKIFYEKPKTIHLRAGKAPNPPVSKEKNVLYEDLPGSILNQKITLDIFPNKNLLDGLAAVIASQDYPLYLTLRPKDPSTPSGYTHVLQIDTLPDSEVKKVRIFQTSSSSFPSGWLDPNVFYTMK